MESFVTVEAIALHLRGAWRPSPGKQGLPVQDVLGLQKTRVTHRPAAASTPCDRMFSICFVTTYRGR
jgi:hypothetical protein